MSILKLLAFSGEIPKLLPRLLPDGSAQSAFDVRLDDGALTPIRRYRFDYSFPGGASTDYRTIYKHAGEWLGWETIVNAAPGPVAQDRLYYTGDGVPKVRVGDTVYPLAVPYPTAPLTTAVSGTGSGDVQTRIYTYTYVTELGEESEPAPPSADLQWMPGQTVTLSGFAEPPAGRGIVSQRIYRSQTGRTGMDGVTDAYFIAERPASSSDFVDNVPLEEMQEPIPSVNWNAPPDGLTGLTAMPNGMMAAFVGKDLYFCEPWRPHAWPENYILTTDYEIVGLGAFGTSLAVITKGTPYVVSGTHPASMVMEKLEMNLPCINPLSIQDLGYAVAYASHDGLVVISSGGARVATEQIIGRTTWTAMNPWTMVSGQYQGRYFASYVYADEDGTEQRGTIIIDLSGEMPFVIRSKVEAAAFFYSIEESALYYLHNGSINEWDARGEISEILSWKSKQFFLPRPTNFGAILVEADSGMTQEEIEALEDLAEKIRQSNAEKIANGLVNGAINSVPMNVYAVNDDSLEIAPDANHFVAVSIYADGKLIATVNKVNEMCRLPSGFMARNWEIEVFGNMRISQISLATTAAELMNV